MDLGYINCKVAIVFGWSRDHSARANEVLPPVQDHMGTWDLLCR